jgi:Ca2+-binding RTX toxin-like protein
MGIFIGGVGNDVLVGTDDSDTLDDLAGNDTLSTM